MLDNIEILNLEQPKKEESFSIRTKLSYYRVYHRKLVGYRNDEKNIEETCLRRFINTTN